RTSRLSRSRRLPHSGSAVAERTIANRETITDREPVADCETIANRETITDGVAVADCEAIANRKAIAEQEYVGKENRSAKQRRAVALRQVVSKRHSFDPHVVVQTLTVEPFIDAVTKQITLTVADLVLVDQIFAGNGGSFENESLAPGEGQT